MSICRLNRSTVRFVTVDPLFYVLCDQIVFYEEHGKKAHCSCLVLFSSFYKCVNFLQNRTINKDFLLCLYGPLNGISIGLIHQRVKHRSQWYKSQASLIFYGNHFRYHIICLCMPLIKSELTKCTDKARTALKWNWKRTTCNSLANLGCLPELLLSHTVIMQWKFELYCIVCSVA